MVHVIQILKKKNSSSLKHKKKSDGKGTTNNSTKGGAKSAKIVKQLQSSGSAASGLKLGAVSVIKTNQTKTKESSRHRQRWQSQAPGSGLRAPATVAARKVLALSSKIEPKGGITFMAEINNELNVPENDIVIFDGSRDQYLELIKQHIDNILQLNKYWPRL